MAATEELGLIALICSRLCHDLAGSVGAVNNGVELLADERDPAMRDEAIGLIALSAGDAARKLAFFRLALGASGGPADPMDFGELARVARDYFTSPKLTLTLPEHAGSLSKPLGKALLLALSLAAAALPRGGRLVLAPGTPDGWTIRAEGPQLRWTEGVAAALGAAGDWPPEPQPAIARYALLLARADGYGLVATPADAGLTLQLTR